VRDPPGCVDGCAQVVQWKVTGNKITFSTSIKLEQFIRDKFIFLGFNLNANTMDLDAIIAYYDSKNSPVCRDSHYDQSKGAIVPDTRDDIFKFHLKQNNTHCTLEVTRDLVTPDKQQDKQFTPADADRCFLAIAKPGQGKLVGQTVQFSSGPTFSDDKICFVCSGSKSDSGEVKVPTAQEGALGSIVDASGGPGGLDKPQAAVVNGPSGSSDAAGGSMSTDSSMKKPMNPAAQWGAAVAGGVIFFVLLLIILAFCFCC